MRSPSFPLISLLLTTGIIATLPSGAMAQDSAKETSIKENSGFYVGVKGGISSPSDETFSGIQDPATPSPGVVGAPADVAVQFDEGATFAGTVGYRLPTRFLGIFQPSIEAEYSYSENDVSGGSFNGGDQFFGGDVSVNTFTLGYRSEVHWKDDQKFIPYAGGSIGIADVDSNINYFPNNGVATEPTFAVSGSDTGLVLHSNLGAIVRVTDTIDLDFNLRYQQISGLDFDRRFVAAGNDAFNADVSGRFETVSGFAGLRYRF